MNEGSTGMIVVIAILVVAIVVFALARGRKSGEGAMAKDVKVDADDGSEGGIEWKINGEKAKDSQLDFPPGSGKTNIDFRLKDKTAHGLRFNPASPIWVHENNAGQCPPAGASDPQIAVVSCTDDVLTIENSNAKASRLRYQLNFLDSNNGDWRCDPEIKNGGK
jgi:hypothetical protein